MKGEKTVSEREKNQEPRTVGVCVSLVLYYCIVTVRSGPGTNYGRRAASSGPSIESLLRLDEWCLALHERDVVGGQVGAEVVEYDVEHVPLRRRPRALRLGGEHVDLVRAGCL